MGPSLCGSGASSHAAPNPCGRLGEQVHAREPRCCGQELGLAWTQAGALAVGPHTVLPSVLFLT